MGKKLIIKGADFSINAINSEREAHPTIEQGVINIQSGAPTQGDYKNGSDAGTTKRLRVTSGSLVYIYAGESITLTGLKGSDGTSGALRIDGAIYSSQSPSHSTILHTLNGDSTDYYKFNTDGGETFTMVAPYSGYYAFAFAAQDLTDTISYSAYQNSVTISIR